MEAIKFSELPSGDRQDLGDGDGLPIIANNENRLLSWAQLKKQLAKQTHTDNLEDSEKVPTAQAVNARVAEAEKAAGEALDTAKSELAEQIDDVSGKAEGADATAKSALASAGSASRDAQSAENKVIETLAQIKEVKTTAGTALTTANETKTEVATASEAATVAQTTANEAKTIAESATSKAEEALAKATETPTVDLSPVNEKITTLETAQTTTDSQLAELRETHEADFKMLNTALANTSETATEARTLAELASADIGQVAYQIEPSDAVGESVFAGGYGEIPETAVSLEKLLTYLNANFQSIDEAIQYFKGHTGENASVYLLDNLKFYDVGTTGTGDSRQFTGVNWGWNSNTSPRTFVDLQYLISVILENQARFAEALRGIYEIASARQNDTATILDSITATLNAVTK